MHLYLHDYSFMDQLTDTLTGSMSLTAATFASVLVASQLKTQLQVFAQVSMVQAVLSIVQSLADASDICLLISLTLSPQCLSHMQLVCSDSQAINTLMLCRCCSRWSCIYCSLMHGGTSSCGQQQPTKLLRSSCIQVSCCCCL